jgi:ribonucleoside-diphosphate reductase alpha chain
MVMVMPYDSDEGRAVSGGLTAILTGRSYSYSAKMAESIGAFKRYSANKKHMLKVIRNHRRAAYDAPQSEYESLSVTPVGLNEAMTPKDILECARKTWDEALELGEKHGYRNAQVTAIAPTGTIGLVMDCDTTGIEPDFALVKFKKLAGGGYFKIINNSIPPALQRLSYGENQIKKIVEYCIGTGTLARSPAISYSSLDEKGFTEREYKILDNSLKNAFSLNDAFGVWGFGSDFLEVTLGIPESTYSLPGFNLLRHLGYSADEIRTAELFACGTMTLEGAPGFKAEHMAIFDTATPNGRDGVRSIHWKGHILMMSAAQPFVSGAISKTINMNGNATVNDIRGAYLMAWKQMLKAIAIYRDGSKLSLPLSIRYIWHPDTRTRATKKR